MRPTHRLACCIGNSILRPLKKPFFNGRNPEERRQSRRGISFRYEAICVEQRFCNALKFFLSNFTTDKIFLITEALCDIETYTAKIG
jgi:hypothetical protein